MILYWVIVQYFFHCPIQISDVDVQTQVTLISLIFLTLFFQLVEKIVISTFRKQTHIRLAWLNS